VPRSIGFESIQMMNGALAVLEQIETFGVEDAGHLHFAPHGAVLLQAKKVCWAAANAMRHRLTDRLRKQRSPPLTRAQLETVFQTCKQSGDPFGQALIASGLVSENGLRTALFEHTADALAHLGSSGAVQTDFVAYAATRYDSRFAFTTVELLAGIGARCDLVGAAAARARLASGVTANREGFAFILTEDTKPRVTAVRNCGSRRVGELLEAAVCAVDASLNSGQAPVRAPTHGAAGEQIVTWAEDERRYVVFCDSEAESRRLVAALESPPRGAGDAC
jgi:hypothetical protein